MALDLSDLLACLSVRPAGSGQYEANSYDVAYRRLFGGQLLAQAVAVLHESGGGKSIKSLTQHFPREGKGRTPLRYAVETVHSGRTFATCLVRASQGDRTVGVASASLHAPEPGFTRNDPLPSVANPEESVPVDLRIVPWDVHVVDGIDLADSTCREPRFRFWMRAPQLADLVDVEQGWVHQALLAHASEPTVIGTALLPIEGLSQADAHVTITSAVTSHSLWFHAPFRLDEWVLVDQHSPVLGAGRAHGRADVWSRDGRLVASIAQESLVRLPSRDDRG